MKAYFGVLCFSFVFLSQGEPWSLEEVIYFARTNAPESKIAQSRVAAANAMLMQANAAFWPHLQAESSYTRTDNPIGVFGAALNQRAYSPALNFNNVPDADNLNVRGLAVVPLYAGGKNRAAKKAAKASQLAEEQAAESTRNLLEFETVRAFHSVLKTRRFIAVAEAAVAAFQTNRTIAERRLNSGTALKSELLELEVQVAQARDDLLRARHASRLAESALKNLIGYENPDFCIAESAAPRAMPPDLDFTQRPELRALDLRVQAAEAAVRREQGAWHPRVNAFGQVDHDSGWKFDSSGRSYAAGLVMQWDVWDGNLRRGKIREAQAHVAEMLEEKRKLRLQIEFEVESAQLAIAEAEDRLRVTESSVSQAEESARLTQSRFEQGLALSSQVIDSETLLTSARVRRTEAESDLQIAIAALRRAIGFGQTEGGQQ